MNSNQVQQTHILTVEAVKVYCVIGNETKFVEQGPLSVSFLLPYNVYIVQVGSFSYSLDKDIPVLAMLPKKSISYPKYVLPNVQGNYIIKICKGVNQEAICSLETVFNNNCSLIYKEEFLETEGTLSGASRIGHPLNQGSKTQVVSNVIRMGGEFSKVGIMKVSEVCAMGIKGLSGLLTVNCRRRTDIDPSEIVINNLKHADVVTATFAGISQSQAEHLMGVGKSIAKGVAQKAQEGPYYQQFENYEHSGKIVKIGKSVVSAFSDIYDGVLEGITIIGREVGDSSTVLAAHTCGPRAGQVTRQSANVVGNLGLAAKAIQKEVIKALHELAADEEQALVDI